MFRSRSGHVAAIKREEGDRGRGRRGREREREGERGEKCGAVTRFPIETERSLTGRRDRFTEP